MPSSDSWNMNFRTQKLRDTAVEHFFNFMGTCDSLHKTCVRINRWRWPLVCLYNTVSLCQANQLRLRHRWIAPCCACCRPQLYHFKNEKRKKIRYNQKHWLNKKLFLDKTVPLMHKTLVFKYNLLAQNSINSGKYFISLFIIKATLQ